MTYIKDSLTPVIMSQLVNSVRVSCQIMASYKHISNDPIWVHLWTKSIQIVKLFTTLYFASKKSANFQIKSYQYLSSFFVNVSGHPRIYQSMFWWIILLLSLILFYFDNLQYKNFVKIISLQVRIDSRIFSNTDS